MRTLRWTLTMSGLALTVWFGACGSSEPSAAPPPARPDTLVVASMADLTTLNPILTSSSEEMRIIANLNYPPAQVDFDCGLVFHPALMRAWARSDDGMAIGVVLRDDIRWSDGELVTARDLQFTARLIANPETHSPRAPTYARFDLERGPLVIDDHTLVWLFKEPYQYELQLSHVAALYAIPEHVFRDTPPAELAQHPANLQPVVNGPWRLASREPGVRYVLEPNPAWSGPRDMVPALGRVVHRILPDPAARLSELKNGNIDMVTGIGPQEAAELAVSNPEIRVVAMGYRRLELVVWNPAVAPFGDIRVRRALTEAIDRQGLISRLLGGANGQVWGLPAVGTISPAFCKVPPPAVTPLPYDLTEARQLMADAGFTDGDGDGFLDREGKKLGFELLVNAENKLKMEAAELIGRWLAQLGVEVHVLPLPLLDVQEHQKHREFEAMIAGLDVALYIDPTGQWRSLNNGVVPKLNFAAYANPAVDELIDLGLKETDPTKRDAIWQRMQELIYADQPYTFLYWSSDLVAVHDRFQHAQVNIISPFHELQRWDVAPDRVLRPVEAVTP